MLLSVLRGLIRRSRSTVPSVESTAPVESEQLSEAQRLLKFAVGLYQAKNFAEAEQALIQVRHLAADNVDALLLLGAVLQVQGRPRESLELLRGPHCHRHETFELQLGIARAASAAGEFEIALREYQVAVSRRPDLPELHVGLAKAYEELKFDAEAIASYRQALKLDPQYQGVHLNLGHLLQKRGDLHEARSCFEAALQLNPDSVKSLFNLGVTLDQLGDSTAAEHYFRKALELEPAELDSAFAHARASLGILLSRRGDFASAISHFERSGKGGLPGLHFNIAISLAIEGRIEEAREHFAQAAKIPADALDWHNDIGIMFFVHGCIEEARPLIEYAAANAGTAPRVQFNLAMVQLTTGPSIEAWDQFVWRFHPAVAAAVDRTYPIKQWQGEALHGRRLLIWGEQGVGDEMMFAGIYAQLEDSGAQVILECNPKLVSLFGRSFAWARVVERRTPASAELGAGIDYQISAGSLGRFFRASLESFPLHDGYLLADESRVKYWHRRLSELGAGLKVGFCWRSSNMKADRALACTRLDEWGELFALPGIHWVCLQYDKCETELESARERFGVQLHRFEGVDYFDDLDEVSALMKGLDLVISAPTTVSVQAAALGIPTWQMSYGTDWQTHGTDRNPWFPAMTRFQRRWDQNWPDVFADVAAKLRVRLAESA
jgi:tetratricopeptide (TPR) repeat protein